MDVLAEMIVRTKRPKLQRAHTHSPFEAFPMELQIKILREMSTESIRDLLVVYPHLRQLFVLFLDPDVEPEDRFFDDLPGLRTEPIEAIQTHQVGSAFRIVEFRALNFHVLQSLEPPLPHKYTFVAYTEPRLDFERVVSHERKVEEILSPVLSIASRGPWLQKRHEVMMNGTPRLADVWNLCLYESTSALEKSVQREPESYSFILKRGLFVLEKDNFDEATKEMNLSSYHLKNLVIAGTDKVWDLVDKDVNADEKCFFSGRFKSLKNLSFNGTKTLELVSYWRRAKRDDRDEAFQIHNISGPQVETLWIRSDNVNTSLKRISFPSLKHCCLSNHEDLPTEPDSTINDDHSFLQTVETLDLYQWNGALVNCSSFERLKELILVFGKPFPSHLKSLEMPVLENLEIRRIHDKFVNIPDFPTPMPVFNAPQLISFLFNSQGSTTSMFLSRIPEQLRKFKALKRFTFCDRQSGITDEVLSRKVADALKETGATLKYLSVCNFLNLNLLLSDEEALFPMLKAVRLQTHVPLAEQVPNKNSVRVSLKAPLIERLEFKSEFLKDRVEIIGSYPMLKELKTEWLSRRTINVLLLKEDIQLLEGRQFSTLNFKKIERIP